MVINIGINPGNKVMLFNHSPFIKARIDLCNPQIGQSIPSSCLYAQGSRAILQIKHPGKCGKADSSYKKGGNQIVHNR